MMLTQSQPTQGQTSPITPRHARAIRALSCVWVCDRDQSDWAVSLRRYTEIISHELSPCDFIVVNNGLGPRLGDRLITELNRTGIPAVLVSLNLPCAEVVALSTAFKHVTGDAVIVLPSYLQSDPRDISRMLDAVRNGLDYVASWRRPRVDSRTDAFRSRLFNWVAAWSSGVRLHDLNSGLRVMRREVLDQLPLYGDLHIYLPVLAARQGFSVGEVPVRHLEERPGRSGHSIGVYLRRGLDLLTLFFLIRFTQKPFRFFGGIGSGWLAGGGLIYLIFAVQCVFGSRAVVDRPMLVFGTLLLVLGIHMVSLGLIGELIIFVSAGGIADYQIEHVFECSDEPGPAEWHQDYA